MKCLNNCGKDAAGRSQYCSDTCKTVYNRNKKRNKLDPSVTAESVTVKGVTEAVAEFMDDMGIELDKANDKIVSIVNMTAKDLYRAINSYPEDTWKDSPEFAALMHRLKTKSVAKLKAEGYYIPSWKYKEAAA